MTRIKTGKRIRKILRGMPAYYQIVDGRKNAYFDKYPQYIMMNLETSCPFNCLKCAQPGRNRKMGAPLSLEERKEILNVAVDCGVHELVIIGAGEPTVALNFQKIMKPLIQLAFADGLGTILFTTGFGINEEQAKFYKDHNVTIFISLDSLRRHTYHKLTGGGNLDMILKNIQTLRCVYEDTVTFLPSGEKIVRLAINTTIHADNVAELDKLEKFAGSDMQYISNVPMPEGKLRIYQSWSKILGKYTIDDFQKLAKGKSETGSHSSVADGVCSYFMRGISIDADGQLLTCGYASDSAFHLDNIKGKLSKNVLLKHYVNIRQGYSKWCKKIGYKPSCPLRDENYEDYLESLSI